MASVLIEATLHAYLEAATRQAWGWGGKGGGYDCATWMAGYVGLVRGGDPAAVFRGRYSTRLGCERLVRKHGGLVQLVAAAAALAGLDPVDEPQRGDIGVIEAPALGRRGIVMEPTAAICLGKSWAVFSPAGLLVRPAKSLAGWTF